ncbi:MAG: helix-turn-helix domain-containing protein [Thaumarchaeota archaeon]|nr:helix-turn-helix domain-containing protein [Nitrososphaerota archaeon]
MFEAVLQGKAPNCWIRDIAKRYCATVNIMDVKALGNEEGIQELFEINVSPELVEPLSEDLRQTSNVSNLELIRTKNGSLYGSAKVQGRPVCMAFIESRCFLISEKGSPNSTVEWRVRGAGETLKDLMGRLEAEGVQPQIKELSNLNHERPLTARQAQILETAMEKGYYEFPRRINLRELAKQVGVKPATLSELLRRAQKKALTQYLRSMQSVS